MAFPATPYFAGSDRGHWIDLTHAEQAHALARRSQLISELESDWRAFDASGAVWSRRFVSPQISFSPIARFLARTIYDPTSLVPVVWTRLRPYEFDELRHLYLTAVEHDDDVLTQFVERDELAQRIRAASSFEGLVNVWKWMETQEECDEKSSTRSD